MSTSTRLIHIETEPDSAYFLRVDCSGRGLASGYQVLLTDGQGAWRGDVSEAAVRCEAGELEMPTERYVQGLREALMGGGASTTYSFTLTPSPPTRGSSVTLGYEKVQRELSFQLGSVSLQAIPEPAETVKELLVHSLQRGTSLENHNHRLEEENQRLRGEHQRITAELKRYAAGKDALEAELYSRFVLVLNEKKAKIRSLQDSIMRLQEARSSDAQEKEDCSKSERTAGEEEEEEEDEYGGSTDEEPEEVPSAPAQTSSSRESSAASPLDDSLKDITDVAPCRKRRFRHLRAPDHVAKRPNPPSSQRKRIDPPAVSSKQQTSQRSAAATSTAEDLFEDF